MKSFLSNRKILIVDDSPTQLLELQFILQDEGYGVITASDGNKALEYLDDKDSDSVDIIITDIVMPGLDGYELCKKIKDNPKLLSVPVVLLTSLSNPMDVIQGLKCGADNFITKPYSREFLINRLYYIFANQEIRKDQSASLGVSIRFAGNKYHITSERVQILDLLFSSFENTLNTNVELKATIQQLKETQQKLKIANKKAEEARSMLNQLATYDALTGIYNRRAFEELAQKMVSLANRKNKKLAVFHLDIDNFKSINDTLGHDFGDKVLKVVVDKVSAILRKEDIIGRIGGDEFALLIMDILNKEEIHTVVGKIIDLFKEPLFVEGDKVYTTLSIGITESCQYKDNIYSELLKEADLAMYEAKKNGKNQYRIFKSQLKGNFVKQRSLEEELNRALREDEFWMVYQPIIDLKSNTIAGVESLIRWKNEKLGTVNPAEFILFAESSKQIHDIGSWVVNEVMSQYSLVNNNNKNNDFFITINISPVQFERDNFMSTFFECVNKYELDPGKIVIEITETAFSQSLVSEVLEIMKKENVLMAIDDFGSGFSSMHRLLEFPVDFMKIDGKYIEKLEDDKKCRAIVKNILNVAKSLKIKAVAECVETKEQADFLIKNGCDYAQGYFYHKPQKLEKLAELFDNNVQC